MFDVVSIGSITRDAFFDASSFPLVSDPNTPSREGFLLPLGDKLDIADVYFTIGGNAANASVTFSRQKWYAACVGKIGNDVAGEEVVRRLKKERVATKFLPVSETLPTAYSVLLMRNGERTILGYHGASNEFSMNDLRLKKLRAKWWYVSLSGESEKMYKPLIAYAKKEEIAVAVNPSGYQLMHRRNEILKSLKDISLLVLNEEEAALLTGIPFSREREVFQKLDALTSPGILAVTNGAKGVTVSDGHRVYRAGTFREKKLVDRTGAGDAFGSGFVAGLLRAKITKKNIRTASEAHINEAIRLASANATSVVEHRGATEGILTRKEADAPRFRRLTVAVQAV